MNIRDIARLADVTPGTVSKVLNDYPDISEATKQHVLRIIEENQYDPRANTRRKPETEAPRIGLVIESVYNPLYGMMEDTLSILIHNTNCEIISFHDNYYIQDKTEKLNELIAGFDKAKLSGLIYIGGNFEQVPREVFAALPCPTVFVNTALPYPTESPVYSSVQVSHYETALAQMQLLIDSGHRDICTVISSLIDNSVYGQRLEAYCAALTKNCLEHNLNNIVETDYQLEKAYASVLKFLQAHPEITAICCETDIVAPAVLRAAQDAGRVTGQDLKLVSFDGLETVRYCVPSVTTFAQPALDMVRHVYQLLFDLIAGKRQHQHITFRPLFIRRESF